MEKPSVHYSPQSNEVEVFKAAHRASLPVLLKGPTGCGKSRFVEYSAAALGLPLVTVACNEDTSASDLIGRFLLKNGETVWQDGPVPRAMKMGALLYLDEVVEAREDVIVLIHPLTDHRRELYLDRTNETLRAHPSFQLVMSYNPGYQSGLKEMKPSTAQRCVTIPFVYPEPDFERKILEKETGCESPVAEKLVGIATKVRSLNELGLKETVSTRLLVHAALLHKNGLSLRDSAISAIAGPLSDDPEITQALGDLIRLKL